MKHLPHSIECEKAALGCVILDMGIFPKIELKEDDFYDAKHRTVFSAMQALYAEGSPIDIPSLATTLGKDYEDLGGIEFLDELMSSAGGSANFAHYCDVIKEKKHLRDIISLSAMINNKCLDEPNKETLVSLLSTIQNQVSQLTKSKHTSSGLLDTFVQEQVAYTEALINGEVKDDAIKTGFPDLDKNIAGLRPGNLVIVSGRPGSGKTAIALDFILNVIRKGHSAAYFSLEMTTAEISQRLIAKIANVGLKSLINGLLSKDELTRLKEASEKPYLKGLFISEENVTPGQIEVFIDSWNSTHDQPLRVLVVDHIQLTGLHDSKVYERRDLQIAKYSSLLKDLAKRKKLCIVALSQLNRNMDARTKGERLPKLSDLRDSGAIEQDADVVLAVYRKGLETLEEADQDSGVLLVLKNRNGQVGAIDLQWVGSRATYRNPVKEDKPEKTTQKKPIRIIQPIEKPILSQTEQPLRRMVDPDTGREILLDFF